MCDSQAVKGTTL